MTEFKKNGQFRAFWKTFDESVNLMASGEVVIQSMWSPAVTAVRAAVDEGRVPDDLEHRQDVPHGLGETGGEVRELGEQAERETRDERHQHGTPKNAPVEGDLCRAREIGRQ